MTSFEIFLIDNGYVRGFKGEYSTLGTLATDFKKNDFTIRYGLYECYGVDGGVMPPTLITRPSLVVARDYYEGIENDIRGTAMYYEDINTHMSYRDARENIDLLFNMYDFKEILDAIENKIEIKIDLRNGNNNINTTR